MRLSEIPITLADLGNALSTSLKSLLTDYSLLLISSSLVGVIQIFTYRADLTIDLMIVSGLGFLLMSGLGLVKHWKEGDLDGKEFLEKTGIQFIVMVSVILLGHLASIILSVVFKIATEAVPGALIVPAVSLYFIFAGYAIMISYYFIKCCDLIESIMPNLLPKWFYAGFKQFRKTGKYNDLLNVTGDKEEQQ